MLKRKNTTPPPPQSRSVNKGNEKNLRLIYFILPLLCAILLFNLLDNVKAAQTVIYTESFESAPSPATYTIWNNVTSSATFDGNFDRITTCPACLSPVTGIDGSYFIWAQGSGGGGDTETYFVETAEIDISGCSEIGVTYLMSNPGDDYEGLSTGVLDMMRVESQLDGGAFNLEFQYAGGPGSGDPAMSLDADLDGDGDQVDFLTPAFQQKSFTFDSSANSTLKLRFFLQATTSDEDMAIDGISVICINFDAPTITKTSDPADGGTITGGDTISYTVVISNPVTGQTQTGIVINDLLPTGTTYVPGSSEATYWISLTGSYTSTDFAATDVSWDDSLNMPDPAFDTTGQIPAGAELTSFAYSVSGSTIDWLSDLSLDFTYPGSPAIPTNASFGGNGSGNFFPNNPTDYSAAASGPAEGLYQFNWLDVVPFGDPDNTITSATFTIEYTHGLTQTTEPAGAPPNLVTAADGIDLQPGEVMTVTFQVTVDDPLDSGITEIVNSASATSNQQIETITDSAINLVSGVDYDFGDLPAAYDNTLLNPDNGARHVMGSLFLGAAVDAETDGQESSDASGDSNDDGLVRDPVDFWTPEATVHIDATVAGGPGRLAGWFDWNGDGDFDDDGEFVDFGSVSGTQTLSLTIPVSYTTSSPIAARFRLFDSGALPGGSLDADDYVGSASNGEVEDYVWEYGPTAVTLQGIRVGPPSSLLIASVIVFMMLTLVSFSIYRFRPVMISRK